MPPRQLQLGLLLFPRLTQLDLTGPFEVFARIPGAQVHLVWKTREAVYSETGLGLLPTTTLDECPELDVICIPGGPGVDALMEDDEVLAFLRRQAASARFVGSVCTGALVLGAAGLLKGKRATTHWANHRLLATLGAVPVEARVVRDGNLFTGGGVTAGIDFALTVVAELVSTQLAQAIQLQLEYAPDPPFSAGSPRSAPDAVVALVRERSAAGLEARRKVVERVSARGNGTG